MNVDIIRRIMSEKKTTFPSLGNQDWRTVKSETEKVNEFFQISRQTTSQSKTI